jgi:hypothetical protein
MCLEVIRSLQSLPDNSVVVDLAIDRKGNALVLVGKWLRSAVNTDDTQTLVSKNWLLLVSPGKISCWGWHTGTVGKITSRPIWTTVTTLLDHLQGRRLEGLCAWHMVAPYNSTHFGD